MIKAGGGPDGASLVRVGARHGLLAAALWSVAPALVTGEGWAGLLIILPIAGSAGLLLGALGGLLIDRFAPRTSALLACASGMAIGMLLWALPFAAALLAFQPRLTANTLYLAATPAVAGGLLAARTGHTAYRHQRA